jgi:hypothetical protein
MVPKGGNPWDGKRAPGVLNTFVVFFLFFHLALRFWNHTCESSSHRSCHLLLVVKGLICFSTRTSNVSSDIRSALIPCVSSEYDVEVEETPLCHLLVMEANRFEDPRNEFKRLPHEKLNEFGG